MATSTRDAYGQMCDYGRETALLASVESLVEWDERTLMPERAGPYRAEQATALSKLVHQRWTAVEFGDLIDAAADALEKDSESPAAVNVARIRKERERKTRLPEALVEELTRTSILGQQAWERARADDDFAAFLPMLEKTYALKREQAEALGYDEVPYDALLYDYEPEELTSNVRQVLGALRDQLVPLVREITESGSKVDTSPLNGDFPIDKQRAFGQMVSERLGFDYARGRMDVTAHPFCTTAGPHDVRITTRFDAGHFSDALFSILHEAGHGIYEQGLDAEEFGLPLGTAVSLGIHESQSRLWENFVGRSRAFWQYFFGEWKKTFGATSADVELDALYAAVNEVRPSLIRVEADEATYNLHIFVRFELEQALVNGEVEVADVRDAWNEKYESYLGIRPPNDAEGVLQDIHWGAGLVGYFSTYALGNLYAAQFFEQAKCDLGDVDAQFAAGRFEPLLEWFREHVHHHGQRYSASELVERVSGKALAPDALIRHLRGKLGPIYGI